VSCRDLIMVDFTLHTKDTTILSSSRDVREPFRFEVLAPRFRAISTMLPYDVKCDSASFIIKGDSLFIVTSRSRSSCLHRFQDHGHHGGQVKDIVPKAVFEQQKKEKA